MTEASRLYEDLVESVRLPLVGNGPVVELLVVALLARGHVLLAGPLGVEASPVVGAVARGLGLSHERVRLTPDMELPDLIGSGGPPDVDRRVRAFSTNVLLADEINRAPPRIQRPLVEAVDEGRVSVRGESVELPRPSLVVATLNAVESDEVYGLPASYRDRFLFELRLDDLGYDEALELLDRHDRGSSTDPETVEAVADPADVLSARESVRTTYVDTSIKEYLLDVVIAAGDHPDVDQGPPRSAAPPLLRAAKALAALRGRDYVIPDDVREIAVPALAPRLLLTTEAELDAIRVGDVVADALDAVEPPGSGFSEPGDDDADLSAAEWHESG